jgi:acetyltransferase-like isoleucine patch superfamily enzyme
MGENIQYDRLHQKPPDLIETIYDDFLARLEEKLADPHWDRNDIVRDILYELHMGDVPDFRRLTDYKFPIGARTLMACFDPRHVILEAEYDDALDVERYRERKPLLWLWQVFDCSPLGANAYLGLKVRRLLAPYIFRRVGEEFTCWEGVSLRFGYNISLGDRVTIHRQVVLDDGGEIEIGHGVIIGKYARIGMAREGRSVSSAQRKTIIGDRVVIGPGATILAGAVIAPGSLVAAMGLAAPDRGSAE